MPTLMHVHAQYLGPEGLSCARLPVTFLNAVLQEFCPHVMLMSCLQYAETLQ